MFYKIRRAKNIAKKTPSLGDHCMASLFVHILNDNKINAILDETFYKDILNCNYNFNGEFKIYEFSYDNSCSETIIENALNKFKNKFKIDFDIKIKKERNFIPIIFKNENIVSKDVVIVSESGIWSKVRDWPYFEQLKEKLSKNSISFIDVTKEKIFNNTFLNYVKKSKVFVSIECGASHLASQLVNKKNSIIIQSGYCNNNFWNFYNYDIIANQVNCNCCFLRRIEYCKNNFKCMREINVDLIFEKILQKMENYKK